MQSGFQAEQLAELGEFAKQELGQAQRDVVEVRVLIKQTAAEVERLTQRNSQSMAKQRDAETNLENLSRQELKQIYAMACESQLRLFMMQSQQEQLQSRQRSLDKYVDALQRVVEVTANACSFSDGQAVSDVAPSTASSSPEIMVTSEASVGQPTIARVIQAQEDERNRVARKIHDGPAQALTNVVLRAEICERLMGIDPAKARLELAQLKDLVANTLRDTRQFIFDVRPMILDDLGLFPTLRKYVEAFREKSKFAVDLAFVGEECRMAPHVEVTAFRIVQEALQNVAQHASASSARVTLYVEDKNLEVVVEDDGVGFDVDEVMESARQHKGTYFGIASMLERVDILGGRVSFESGPGRGTKLLATIPLGA